VEKIMALVLSGERSSAAAAFSPVRIVVAWFAKARAERVQRLALDQLLDLDPERLDDLGINRGDLFDAMHASHRKTRLLTDRRALRRV